MAYAMDRTYSYSSDGSSVGWSTSTSNDVPRTLFYDMSNRLLCGTTVAGSASCPGTNTPPFLEAFTYDATDSRLRYRDSTGTTTYTYNGVAMTREDPPGTYDRRQFYALTNGGNRTSDRDQTIANTTRTYTYDGLQRLRQVTLSRPGVTIGSFQTHLITVHYDHRARPYYVTVLNQASGVEERNRYYYGLDDELITWIRTPAASTPTTYEERQYVPIGDFAVGEMYRSWASGSATRRTYYHAVEPMGLELGAFEFEHSGGAAVTYNPQTSVQRWTGFGMRMYQTGAGMPLPTRFPGQLELRASDVRIWNGSNTTEFAHALYLNRWRSYDPRVGQYLQPDPAATDSRSTRGAAYTYVHGAPADAVDPTGEFVWCECLGRAILSFQDQVACFLCNMNEPRSSVDPPDPLPPPGAPPPPAPPGDRGPPCTTPCSPPEDGGCRLTTRLPPVAAPGGRGRSSGWTCIYTCTVGTTFGGIGVPFPFRCSAACPPQLSQAERECALLSDP